MNKPDINIRVRQSQKNFEFYIDLKTMSLMGLGNNTVMIAYPDAPFHYESDIRAWWLDGVPQLDFAKRKVFDYPVKTVDEWIGIYKAQGHFV